MSVYICLFVCVCVPAVCSVHLGADMCTRSFWNGVCDPRCDFADNFYDGFDCSPDTTECPSDVDETCRAIFANGVCDEKCNSVGCAWDGGDCIDKPLIFADDTIVLTLPPWYQYSTKLVDIKQLGRALSKLLRTIVRVLPEDWVGDHQRTASHSSGIKEPSWHRPHQSDHAAVRRVYAKVDNTRCTERCFEAATSAARFIALALHNGWDPGIRVASVGGGTIYRSIYSYRHIY